jgi:two-component system nitrogen regulation sensor histidine kinase NtrY
MTTETSSLIDPAEGSPARAARRFEWARWIRASGYLAVALALASAASTFLVLVGLTPIAPTPDVVLIAMLVNGGLISFLILVTAWEVVSLVRARLKGRAGSGLHIRIVALFSLIAASPAALLAVTASITLDRGLDNWFSERTRAIVDNTLSLAQAFAEEQAQLLRSDLLSVKSEVQRSKDILNESQEKFEVLLTQLVTERHLPGTFLVDSDGSWLSRAATADEKLFPPPPKWAITQAKLEPGQVVIIPPVGSDIIAGIAQLANFDDVFIYGAREVDPQVNSYLAMTNNTVTEYKTLEASRFGMQVAFAILFLGVTVVVLLSAIWLGIGFANRLVSPIRRLIDAAKEVSRGNLSVAVEARSSDGDVGALGSTFNTMTSQLRGQREELVAASNLIDTRRRFTEAVLSGISAGVVGIDSEGNVTIANRTALAFLGVKEEAAIGTPISKLLGQLQPIVSASLRDSRPEHRDQITVIRNGRERTINVRVTTERSTGQAHGYVITFDDISDLVSAQRSSAWADVARRIAHEIKNPLTPIQLSAERLKRKFGRTIVDDRDVFDQCTDTIIRQVGDIGRMVDEFSSFARMPKPAFTIGNLAGSIREAVFLISVAQPDITFGVELPQEPLVGRFDARLLGQALTNVVKNATEAIGAVPASSREKGEIKVTARTEESQIIVDVIDNGIGLPSENRHRLLEPYVTTREKGTGLGLAIVAKIIEEHGGRIELLDAPSVAEGGHGAMVRITLPRAEPSAAANVGTPERASETVG